MEKEVSSLMSVPQYPPGNGVTQEEPKRDRGKVIKGPVERRKRPLSSRVASLLVGEEVQDVKEYIIYETIIPGIKETILEALEMMLFPNATRSRGSKSRRARGNSYSVIDYGSFSRDKRSTTRIEPRTSKAHWDELTFYSKQDALIALQELREDIRDYNEARLARYYELAGYSSDFTDNDFGWTNLDHVGEPRRIRGGKYILDLPAPKPLG